MTSDYRVLLNVRAGQLVTITAKDVLEHLPKDGMLDKFDLFSHVLIPGRAFVARVPNAASALAAGIRFGDFIYKFSHIVGSLLQVAAAAGFVDVSVQLYDPAAARTGEHGAVDGRQLRRSSHGAWMTRASSSSRTTSHQGLGCDRPGVIAPECRCAVRRRDDRGGCRVVRTWLYAMPNEGIARKTLRQVLDLTGGPR